jgi:hypothetical protein
MRGGLSCSIIALPPTEGDLVAGNLIPMSFFRSGSRTMGLKLRICAITDLHSALHTQLFHRISFYTSAEDPCNNEDVNFLLPFAGILRISDIYARKKFDAR